MEKTTLYVTAEIARGLKDVARRTGRTRAELIREALEEYLGKQPRPCPRFIGVAASSDGWSAADDEAWLDQHWLRDVGPEA